MKNILITAISCLLVGTTVFAGGEDKITFKQKIEQSKDVKIFFNLRVIKDEAEEKQLKQTDPNAGTMLLTEIPASFASDEIKKEVIRIMNEGLQVGSAFSEGDITTLPETTNSEFRYRDLSQLPNGLYGIVDIFGEYKRVDVKKEKDGKVTFEVHNGMEIKSRLFFYEVTNGAVVQYDDATSKSGVLLGNASAQTKITPTKEGLDYMRSNFPADSLLEEYTGSMYRFTQGFIEKQLKKDQKAQEKQEKK